MCVIPECEGPDGSRGMCDKHYKRWWRYGDPNFTKRKQRWVLEECWSPGEPDECWIWRGEVSVYWGYGLFGRKRAHRVIYEKLVGPIPHGLVLDHLCRVKLCVNPAHLEPVISSINVARGKISYAIRALCRNNLHDITSPESWYIGTYGNRTCLECKRANDRRGDAKRGRRYARRG